MVHLSKRSESSLQGRVVRIRGCMQDLVKIGGDGNQGGDQGVRQVGQTDESECQAVVPRVLCGIGSVSRGDGERCVVGELEGLFGSKIG